MRLQKTLKSLLEKKQLTYKQVAEATGVSPNTLKTWMTGSQPRNLNDVRKVAHFLGVTFEGLIFGAEENKPPRTLNEIITTNLYSGWCRISIDIPADKKSKE